jgi:hypothetical protein
MKSLRFAFFILVVQSLVTYEKSMLDSRVDYNIT